MFNTQHVFLKSSVILDTNRKDCDLVPPLSFPESNKLCLTLVSSSFRFFDDVVLTHVDVTSFFKPFNYSTKYPFH